MMYVDLGMYREWKKIQGDQKVSVHLMITIEPHATLQTFIDTSNCVLEDRVHYITVHIQNVLCVGHFKIINYLVIVTVRWTETFR